MRRRNFDVLIAWLDAVRRRDRKAMLTMLAPGAKWQGVRPEWVCATPAEVVDMWLERAEGLRELEALELVADERRAALHLRASTLREVDERLRYGVHVGFEIDADGRIARIVDGVRRRDVLPLDAEDSPRGVPEAPVVEGVPQGEGWFVVNVADAKWAADRFGAYTMFQGDVGFEQYGVNVAVLEPGQPACWYHREADQEDFLVLRGEPLLLVQGEERRLRQWDFVHCPPWTEHVFVGAGTTPCAILAIGGRMRAGVVYPDSEVARRHGAAAPRETTVPTEAYAEIPDAEPVAFDPRWLA